MQCAVLLWRSSRELLWDTTLGEDEMKEYKEVELEIIEINAEDIITNSGCYETPL